MSHAFVRTVSTCLLAFGLAGPVFGQSAYDTALARLQANPSDPAASVAFVQAAIQARQVRPAIGRLEALLARRPDLANIRLELGLLYLRAGSPQLAEQFIEEALRAPDVPPQIRRRAELALEESLVEQRKDWVAFELAVTTRYETNATAAPESTDVQRVVGGNEVIANLDTDDTAQADVSFTGSAGVRFGYDLGTQFGDRVTGALNYFGSRYLEQDQLDLDVVSAQLGSEFVAGSGPAQGMVVRPFVSGSYVRQDDVDFLTSVGGGADLQVGLGGGTSANGRAELRRSDYIQSSENPANDLRDAVQYVFRGGIGHQVTPDVAFFGSVGMARNAAEAAFESYWEASYRLAVRYRFSDPTGLFSDRLDASLGTGYRHRRHDRPDFAIDLDDAQRDNRATADLTLRFPIAEQASLDFRGGYVLNASNYAIEDFSNFSVSSRLAVRF